jgi:signal transduction histidine kinase
MIIGVVGLCVGFLVGSLGLLVSLGYVVQRSADAEALATAHQIADLVNADALPQPVPVSGEERVQVIDGAGRIRSYSIDADRLVPMLHPDELELVRRGERLFVEADRFGVNGPPMRVVGVPAGPADDPQTVVVARSMVDAVRGLGVLRTILFIVFPLLVAALSAVAWRVIEATLRPVESLRRGAEEITGAGASARLPVPRGGDEIHRLAVTLNGMLDRLEAGRIRQREFVGDAAHELRSPLANMRTQLEVAQRLGPDADWPVVADDLLVDTQRLSRLVDDLLLLARTDGSAPPARPEPVELGGLLASVAARHPCASVSAAGPVWTVGDADELHRLVSNLVDNAVRYADSRVLLETTVDGPWAVVTITDDGPGIPVADRGRVFERFTRLDDARARDAGARDGGERGWAWPSCASSSAATAAPCRWTTPPGAGCGSRSASPASPAP